mgnify:CR=1 FL=1
MTPQNPAIDTKLIITAIENLRALCQTEVQAAWRYSLLDLTANQVFQEDISKWDVSNVENMSFMFCNSKFTKDLTNWQPLNFKRKYDIFCT